MGLTVAAALVAFPRLAHADNPRLALANPAQSPPVGSAPPEPPPDADPERPEHPLFVALEAVIGQGRWYVLNTTGGANPNNSLGWASITTMTWLPSAAYKLTDRIALSAHIPVTAAWVSPTGLSTRSTIALGNLETGASFTFGLSDDLSLIAGLDLAFPTAQGTELPAYQALATARPNADFDRYAANATASAVRGWDTLALFQPNTFAASPRVFLPWRPSERWFLGLWARLENLFATAGGGNIYSADLVAGVRVDFRLIEALEVGTRFWINAPLANQDQAVVSAIVEPELRLHLGTFAVLGSAIVPLAGPSWLTDPRFWGIRLAVMNRF